MGRPRMGWCGQRPCGHSGRRGHSGMVPQARLGPQYLYRAFHEHVGRSKKPCLAQWASSRCKSCFQLPLAAVGWGALGMMTGGLTEYACWPEGGTVVVGGSAPRSSVVTSHEIGRAHV